MGKVPKKFFDTPRWGSRTRASKGARMIKCVLQEKYKDFGPKGRTVQDIVGDTRHYRKNVEASEHSLKEEVTIRGPTR